MERNTETIQIKVYRDGRLSRMETYGPVVKREVIGFLNKVDYWIGNYGQWPHGTID